MVPVPGRAVVFWKGCLTKRQLPPTMPNMSKKRTEKKRRFSDQIRRLIDSCGMSRYQISKHTGIDQAALSRFMSGERGLSRKALDEIGELLDLEVIMHGPRRS